MAEFHTSGKHLEIIDQTVETTQKATELFQLNWADIGKYTLPGIPLLMKDSYCWSVVLRAGTQMHDTMMPIQLDTGEFSSKNRPTYLSSLREVTKFTTNLRSGCGLPCPSPTPNHVPYHLGRFI